MKVRSLSLSVLSLVGFVLLSCNNPQEAFIELLREQEAENAIATPVIEYSFPTDFSEALVTLSCSTEGIPLYYTYGESPETPQREGSNEYSVPFTVDLSSGPVWVKARAIKNGREKSGTRNILISTVVFTADPVEEFEFDASNPGWDIETSGMAAGDNWYYSSDDQAYEIAYDDQVQDSWLVSPAITLPQGPTSWLLFEEYWQSGWSSGWSEGYIMVSTDNGTTWEELSHLHSAIPGTDEVIEGTASLSLAGYEGETVNIAWRYYGYNDWYWFVRDIRILTEE